MDETVKKTVPPHIAIPVIIFSTAFFIGIYYGITHYLELKTNKLTLEHQVKDLNDTLKVIEDSAFNLRSELEIVNKSLEEEKARNRKISNQVSDLKKLAKTDPELLRKYSKVYFLNEHYSPPKLRDLDAKYIFPAGREIQVHSEVLPFLEDLLDEAKEDEIELYVTSGYRSFETQQAIKSENRITYGAGTANSFIADQGYSEHQLGTTVDFTTKMSGLTNVFEKTAAYAWLQKNAHRYGFVLSYPKNNAYYIFEPWHWRYVGEDLARDLYKDEKYFYDLDQREIDDYLVDIFE